MKNRTPSGDIALAMAAELIVVVAIFIGALVAEGALGSISHFIENVERLLP